MSVIEDSRKVVQDFLAPELRSIAVRLDALEKRYETLDRKIDQVDARWDKRQEEFSRHLDKRFDSVLAAIAQSSNYNVLLERVARLESRDNPRQ